MASPRARSLRIKFRRYKKSLLQWVERWRWFILTSIGLSLLWVEVQEFLVLRILHQAFHYFEIFQYAVLLISTGLLLELFVRSEKSHKQALKILEYKHSLSLDFTSSESWESLTTNLAELPGRIAEVEESYLLVNNLTGNKFETVGRWKARDAESDETWDPMVLCETCLNKGPDKKVGVLLLKYNGASLPDVYCLEISSRHLPMTSFRFKLKAGAELSTDQIKVFNNIRDDVAVALRAGEDRKRLSELRLVEVAMAERRTVSAYVHDQLGQNLGYLHLKLDQLSSHESIARSHSVQTDVQRLREVANESYEIVRDILKKMQPETTPHLTNLLHEHARIVAERANFDLEFECIGEPAPLLPDVQRTIFYTFREILNNVERHATAGRVKVLVIWSQAYLDISVADDGIGFDPRSVEKGGHFGLEIMQERIDSLKGQVLINSSTDSGTVVSISMPLVSMASMTP